MLFGQSLSLNDPWELGIGHYDENLRIFVHKKWIDIPLPAMWKDQEYAVTDVNSQGHRVTDTWKMLAVTFIRAKQIG